MTKPRTKFRQAFRDALRENRSVTDALDEAVRESRSDKFVSEPDVEIDGEKVHSGGDNG